MNNLLTPGHSHNPPTTSSKFENAPACCRAPRWPDPEFPQNAKKMPPPGPKFRNPPKYPENTERIPQTGFFWYFGGILGAFWGILGVNSGSPEFRAGGYFFGIFHGNSGSDHLGALQQAGAFSNLSLCFVLSSHITHETVIWNHFRNIHLHWTRKEI